MEWLGALFLNDTVAQSVVILALVVAIGLLFSKIKIGGISFGITWILFAGIAFGHFNLGINGGTLHFVKEFGLILFVYSIGLQVGPGFFSSFKKGGVTLNLLAMAVVVLGVVVTLTIRYLTGIPISTMVGVMSGAITNTPGLGAAQQTFMEINGVSDPNIAMGYAVAYPLGVLGIIFSLIIIRFLFKVDFNKEQELWEAERVGSGDDTVKLSLKVENPALFGKKLSEVKGIIDFPFIISRIVSSDGVINVAVADTVIEEGSELLVITSVNSVDRVVTLFGKEITKSDKEWATPDLSVEHKKIIVTKNSAHGRSLADLKLGSLYGITVSRIHRAGVDLVPTATLRLQIGDMLTVVGENSSIKSVTELLGNSSKRLSEPNLVGIFIGIALGIIVGSIPFKIPGIPQAVKLGLAGGPLIVAILISRFGPNFKLVTYTTVSANLMLREIGIALFLAAVGLDAGGGFVETVLYQGGAVWILYGVLITMIPILIVGSLARMFLKINFFTLMGLIAGSTTDPPALAYAGATAGNNLPAVSYATVYPLTMFLRVLFAQLLILLF